MKRHHPSKTKRNRKEEQNNFFSQKEHKGKENTGSDSFFQAKLEVGDPSSPFEKEADAMADHVLDNNKDKSTGDAFGKQSVQRQAEEEEPAAKRIQRQAEEEEPAAKRIQRQAEEEEPAAKRIQRQAEEEEPAAKRIQRQAEEEEPAAKRIQRQAEEEEPAAKRIQRQAEEEEPAAKRIQRQAEEEEPAAKRIQRQAEEEEPAAKRIQRQAEEEEPAAKRIQRQAEEEEPAAKRIQRQAEEEEPATKQVQRKAEESSTISKFHHVENESVQAKGGSSKNNKNKMDAQPSMESIESMIQETKGQGMPLPEEIKVELEAEMKADFSNVRIHTDEKAIELSAMLHAQAFTHGYDIYFNTGKYNPYSREGKHLLVHELTHVVQQKG
ncbi:hypothetical protein ATO12_05485 [Aquimarina atlantica]|uniref:eCIS core domain-containing protein n=1 Tax=Aquimarina atlantica TaxID=1317122 RepID=A0A023BPC5_9FLAO|nr:DUF4157 domain-containing protein [Aquimarina atlantica]EZH71831.1 hypothetical protein ATO12_05485 [Aquimarina atlantica]